jgi:hypothetical protein
MMEAQSMRILTFSLLAAAAAGALLAGQTPQDPHDAMHARGAHVMGFDQDATTHHFYLYTDGGAIDVSANDQADAVNVAAIRSHLPHIAQMFGSGDFSSPMLVHAVNVPGTADLARLTDRVRFSYVETPRGGRVEAKTSDPAALKALYAFLRFQISDHRTGDSPDVRAR